MSGIAIFSVAGLPVQEGNISFGKNGQAYHREGDRLQQWRTDIGWAAKQDHLTRITPEKRPWAGPVEVCLYFTYKASRKAQRGTYKDTRPDIDKLTRAALDALTGVLFKDDAQVARLEVWKTYVDEDELAGLTVNARALEPEAKL